MLLSHPKVAEAVAFGAPDEKFGEVVAAAIVPTEDIADQDAFIADVKRLVASKLAKFKVRSCPNSDILLENATLQISYVIKRKTINLVSIDLCSTRPSHSITPSAIKIRDCKQKRFRIIEIEFNLTYVRLNLDLDLD